MSLEQQRVHVVCNYCYATSQTSGAIPTTCDVLNRLLISISSYHFMFSSKFSTRAIFRCSLCSLSSYYLGYIITLFLPFVYYKLFLTCLICSISTILVTNSLNSVDVPLSNKQTNVDRPTDGTDPEHHALHTELFNKFTLRKLTWKAIG